LEGELADYNLALDKQRSGTKQEDILSIHYHIQMQNEKQAATLDEMFIERKSYETQISQLEEQIAQITKANEEKLNDLDPDQKKAYDAYKEENNKYQESANQAREEIEDINAKLSKVESLLKGDTIKQQAQALREEKNKLLQRKEGLELQTNEMNLPFNEARDRLLNKTKEDQQEIKQLEQKVGEFNKIIDTQTKQLKDLELNIEDRKNEMIDPAKLEAIANSEKVFDQYIENFDKTKEQESAQIAILEASILQLLDNITRYLRRLGEIPTLGEAKDIELEYNFKADELKKAENTFELVEEELAKMKQLKNDLNKLELVQTKTEKEKKVMEEKMSQMNTEVSTKFNKIDEILAQIESEKKRIAIMTKYYEAKKDTLSNQVAYMAMKIDAKTQALNDNETHKCISDLESRIVDNESNIARIESYMETKKADSGYQEIKSKCMDIVTNMNMEIIKEALTNKEQTN
jgi:chromosome segregation ATPase